jgi:hypothetical protein
VRDRVAEVQQEWEQGLSQLVAEARERGELRADEDPAQLAFELNSYLLLGNTAFVLHDDPAFLQRARSAVARRLAAAMS